jgi:hypothetical protein
MTTERAGELLCVDAALRRSAMVPMVGAFKSHQGTENGPVHRSKFDFTGRIQFTFSRF